MNIMMNLTKSNFDETINQDKPVLVDFWAEWCGPCRMLTPIMAELDTEYNNDAIVAKVNVDEQMELAQKFGIMSIPNVILFHKGDIVDNTVGVRDKNYYASKLLTAIDNK
jgi:thioredoxin 1